MPETLNKQDELMQEYIDLQNDLKIAVIGLAKVNDPIDLEHVIAWLTTYVRELKDFNKKWRA